MTTDLDRAFARLDDFQNHRLPKQLRLLRIRTAFHPGRHADILDDLKQELALDCAQQPELIAELEELKLWQRWHRLIQRNHYALRGHRTVSLENAPPPLAAESKTAKLETLTTRQRELLRGVQSACVLLKNGRLNIGATAKRLKLHPRVLENLWAHLTEELNFGEAYSFFWSNRLAEAVLDLIDNELLAGELTKAALSEPDLEKSFLTDPLTGHATGARSCDDGWKAFRRRFRRIRRALNVRRQPERIRNALLRLTPRRARGRPQADQLLATAAELAPRHPRLAPLRARIRDRGHIGGSAEATATSRGELRAP